MNKYIIAILLIICCFSFSTASSINNVNDPQVECDLCNVVVSASEYLIKNGNMTKPQVEAELKKICTIIPSNMTKECDLFMLFAAPVITTALFNGENPETLCTQYKMCVVTPSPTPTSTPTSASKINTIDINDYINNYINKNNNNNNNNNPLKDLGSLKKVLQYKMKKSN